MMIVYVCIGFMLGVFSNEIKYYYNKFYFKYSNTYIFINIYKIIHKYNLLNLFSVIKWIIVINIIIFS